MIVTEEEAKTKICCESLMPLYVLEGATGGEFVPGHCLGSACMAWSWWLANGSNGIDRTQSDDNSKGFCGKAIVR